MGTKLLNCITEEKRHSLNISVLWGSTVRETKEEADEAAESSPRYRCVSLPARCDG